MELEFVQVVMKFNFDEKQKIETKLKNVLKEIDNIKATYKALQNSKIREIKAFNIYDIVPKKVKKSKDVCKIHVQPVCDNLSIHHKNMNSRQKAANIFCKS